MRGVQSSLVSATKVGTTYGSPCACAGFSRLWLVVNLAGGLRLLWRVLRVAEEIVVSELTL